MTASGQAPLLLCGHCTRPKQTKQSAQTSTAVDAYSTYLQYLPTAIYSLSECPVLIPTMQLSDDTTALQLSAAVFIVEV